MAIVRCTKCKTVWLIEAWEAVLSLLNEVKVESAYCPVCGTRTLVWA